VNQTRHVYYSVWRHAVLGGGMVSVRLWSWMAVLATCAGIPLAIYFWNYGEHKATFLSCTLPLAGLALFLWMRFVSGAVRQNTPANAQLVPGLHRTIRRVTMITWGLMLVVAAVIAAAFEYPMLMFVALAAVVTSQGLARGGRSVGSVIYLVLVIAIANVAKHDDLLTALSTPTMLTALIVLNVILAREGLRTVFPAGGEGHWRLLKNQVNNGGGMDAQQVTARKNRGWRARLYGTLLQRDLGAGAHPEHLLLHALGPNNHRLDFVAPLAALASCALVVKLAVTGVDAGMNQFAVGIISAFSFPMILLQPLTLNRMVVSMNTTRGEQSLVRLAPRAPRSDRLGRSLAYQLLAISMGEWLVCSLGLLALLALFGASVHDMQIPFSAMCVSLAASGWVVRDYSGQRPTVLGEVVVQSVLVGAGGIALVLVRDDLPLWTGLAALLLGCAFAIVSGRWKTMVNAPVQFPAGRFA
jgi:hypothetical protein